MSGAMWKALVAQVPCVVCQQLDRQSQSQVHHMRFNDLGKRKSDFLTIALCQDHHVGKYSIHHNREAFERQFGSEIDLHAATLAGVAKILRHKHLV